MKRLFAGLRALVLLGRTTKGNPGAIEKCARAVWCTGTFGAIVVLTRLYYLLRGHCILRVTTADATVMNCRLPDMIPLYIATFGTWEPDVAALIRTHLRPGDLFVDIGANIGYHTLLAARIVGSNGGVVALEPHPLIRSWLTENLALNPGMAPVRVVAEAAWDCETQVRMESAFTHNTGRNRTLSTQQTHGVAAAPLDRLLTDREIASVRLIKIDVEGAEPAVLRGMLEVVDRAPRNLVILVELSARWWEEHDKLPADVLEPYRERGFFAYRHANSYWPWRYLWPRCITPARPCTNLHSRPRRIDLVLVRQG